MQTGKKKGKKKKNWHTIKTAFVWKIRDDLVALLSQQYIFELAKQPKIDYLDRNAKPINLCMIDFSVHSSPLKLLDTLNVLCSPCDKMSEIVE